ncbi:MAG TPA: Sjogren's syndrome/scleroderma autoantigen 1 family protein [Methanosarcina sp.]
MDSEKDKKVKRIAHFLEIGGTMLAEHCKVCGAPKFRYQGTVICPICDVQEEGETPEQVIEAEAPEPKPYMEKEKPSSETKKRVQAHRQKPRFGMRNSEVTGEEEKGIEPVEEEIPMLPSENEDVRRVVPEALTAPATSAIQAVSSRKAEKSAAVSKVSGINVSGAPGDRRVLENLLFKKMVSIADSLQDETDPRSIAEDLELIEKGLGLIERLRQL